MCSPPKGDRDHNGHPFKRQKLERERRRPTNDGDEKEQKRHRRSFLSVLNRQDNITFHQTPPILLSEQLKTARWLDDKPCYDIGIVVDINLQCQDPQDESSRWSLLEQFLGQIGLGATHVPSEEVLHFLLHQQDEFEVVQQAVEIYKRHSADGRVVGDDDLGLWETCRGNERQKAFFYRLMRPLCLRFIDMQQRQQQQQQQPVFVKAAPFSFLDVLLRLPGTRTAAVDAIVIQLERLDEQDKEQKVKLVRYLEEACQAFDEPSVHTLSENIDYLARQQSSLYSDLVWMIPRCECDVCQHAEGVPESRARFWERHFEVQNTSGDNKDIHPVSFCSKRADKFQTELTRERQKLIDRHRSKYLNPLELRRSNRKALGDYSDTMEKEPDGTFVVKAKDVSLEEFISHTKLMNVVNETFPRPYYPGISRPKLQQLDGSLTTDQVRELWKIFFDEDGSLSNSIRNDIDLSAKHGYINFSNVHAAGERQDKRWQVPIRKHGLDSLVRTRSAVEGLLSNIINPEEEVIYDLGILMGGTADQSLHHDCSRQVISWDPQKPGQRTIPGWEVDRLAYNDAMASPIAPSSVLIGMDGTNELLVGVQRDQVLDLPSDGSCKQCRAIGGVEGQKFDVARENEHLVVARAKTGVMFTGDFPHAGVRNIVHGTEEDRLMDKLYQRIDGVLEGHHTEDPLAQIKAIIDILCNFPGLNRLCRFHCSTEIKTGRLSIPQNTIGFTGCLPNSPDLRCLGEESLADIREKKQITSGPVFKPDDLDDSEKVDLGDDDGGGDDSSDYDPDDEQDQQGTFWMWSSSPKKSPPRY